MDGGEAWETTSAIQGDARVHNVTVTDKNDLQLTLIKNQHSMHDLLRKDLLDLRQMKWYITAFIRCQLEEDPQSLRYMRCVPIITLREDELVEQIQEAILGVVNNFDKCQAEGSQILFDCVDRLEIRVAKYSPLKGSSYLPLPKHLQNSNKGLINIQNFNDEKCFLYCCLAAINLPEGHPERVSKYRGRLNELNFRGIKFPVSIPDITKFEKQNPGYSVNVFGLEEEKHVVPLRISKVVNGIVINTLLLRGEDEEDECHYVLIKNLSAFLCCVMKQNRTLFWCENCLMPCYSQEKYQRHKPLCLLNTPQVVKMPQERDSVMRFRQFGHQMHHDFVVYADFESIIVPLNTPLPDPSVSATTKTSCHVPCGFCYIIVKADGSLLKEPVLVHGKENLVQRFLMCLKEEEEHITKLRGDLYEIDMSAEQEAEFQKATNCYLCGETIPRQDVKKVRDHDWSKPSCNYRGAACQYPCNLNLKRKSYIPVMMHNLKNYDAHLIISEIGVLSDGSDVSVIPKNKEKYIGFQWGKLRFLDSLGFLNSSLEKLVADLAPEEMHSLKAIFPNENERNLVTRKGVYPYSYFDCFEKFEETCLPPIECFKNDLTGENIKPEDYQHAVNVFQTFKLSSLREFHDLYLLTDVLLLSDCMENFRKIAMEHYKLDPVHYFTTPGLAFSASLLYTKQRLELIDDIEIHLMFERGMRGGVASINHRYVKSNNPYIPETYCADEPHSYIMYYDANSLYSTALCEKLPIGGFRFLTDREIDEFDVTKINPESDIGYLFEVDLEYPTELHDKHNDYPLAPEHVEPQYKDLSKLQKKLVRDYELSRKSTKKLIPTLSDKKNYVLLGDLLLLYAQLGLKVKKIHRVIEFEQKAWLKPFIEHNINMRKKATSDFQKSFWKLMCNSVFGKTCEAVRNHRSVVLTKEREKFRKLVRSPLFHSFDIFNHGLVCVERKKARIVLNRPLFVGQSCLDISKYIMYGFYYYVLKAKYGDNIRVCATDTDSLIVHVFTDDIYADMSEMSEHFDTSDYPTSHPLYSLQNKKVMGKFKDEMNSEPIISFIGLRAKMYSFKTKAHKEKSVGKGIPRAALKSQLCFEDYQNCITQFKRKSVNFSKIATDRKHNVYTTYSTKRGLSCYDDKRYILNDNISTLAHGHYKIKSLNAVHNDECTSDTDDEDDEGARNLRELILLQEEMSM
ncbi:uncharacterized protein LOC113211531 [Frankliniella occidentalis]|uniref:Uncharacterized protein LOC113211531 n=1 Tax=Frankliniella occidentalis TaxID=133901 RepID=A0A6J1SWU3_FRAOC|nr:uncharacterized protein LOC113211531 [Frankliniella occidentalis]